MNFNNYPIILIITQQLPISINQSLILQKKKKCILQIFKFLLKTKSLDFNYLTISRIILGEFLMWLNGIKIIIILYTTQKLNTYKSNIYILIK